MYIETRYGKDYTDKINQFDHMVNKINQDFDQFNVVLKELYEDKEKSIKLQGSNRLINESDVKEIILKCVPVIKVKKSDTSVTVMIYHPFEMRWTEDLEFIEESIMQLNKLQIRNSFTIRNIRNVIDSFVKDMEIPVVNISKDLQDKLEINEKNQFKTYIDFRNGRYDLQTYKLKKLMPSDLALSQLSYNIADYYDKDNYKEVFDDYFYNIANKNKERAHLLKQIAYCVLLNYNPDKKALNLYGKSGGGKSTFMKILNIISSNKSLAFTYNELEKDDALAEIKDNRLLLGYDNNDRITINRGLAVFKSLVSKESFSYSVKYKSRQSNIFYGLFIQAFNDMPEFSTKSSKRPISDRILLIEFNSKFRNTNNEINDYEQYFKHPRVLGQFVQYLINEVPAFNKFCYDDNETKDELLKQSDSVYQFVQYVINTDDVLSNKMLPMNHLNRSYIEYMNQSDPQAKKVSAKTLNSRLNEYMQELNYNYHVYNVRNDQSIKYIPKQAEKENKYKPDTLFNEYFNIESLSNYYSSWFIKDDIESIDDIQSEGDALLYINQKYPEANKDPMDNMTKYNLTGDIKECNDLNEIKLLLRNHFSEDEVE